MGAPFQDFEAWRLFWTVLDCCAAFVAGSEDWTDRCSPFWATFPDPPGCAFFVHRVCAAVLRARLL